MSDTNQPSSPATPTSRRHFLKAAGAAAVTGAAVSQIAFPTVTFGVPNDKKLKIGLIGAGGRGTGAAAQALTADDNVELTAIGDLYQQKIVLQIRQLAAADPKAAAKLNLGNNIFAGLDAYKQVMDTGVDIVLLTTPPGFRPTHFREAVERGIHVFAEKPCASDVEGVNKFLEAGKLAREKDVSVLAGFCYRYNDAARELFKRILDGEIGDVHSMHSFYYADIAKPMPPAEDRPAGMSDVEWQLKNWYNFTWLSGDGLVEQGIHNVDRVRWALNDAMPVKAYGSGGRQRPNNEGNIYDHFDVTYEFENDVRAFVAWRQYMPGTYNTTVDYIYGTKGMASFSHLGGEIKGENNWKYRRPREPRNMYQIEHNEFFADIREGKRHADEEWMADSTLMGIMGRMVCYTGKDLSLEDVKTSGENLVPDNLTWDSELPIRPMAIPGVAETQNV